MRSRGPAGPGVEVRRQTGGEKRRIGQDAGRVVLQIEPAREVGQHDDWKLEALGLVDAHDADGVLPCCARCGRQDAALFHLRELRAEGKERAALVFSGGDREVAQRSEVFRALDTVRQSGKDVEQIGTVKDRIDQLRQRQGVQARADIIQPREEARELFRLRLHGAQRAIIVRVALQRARRSQLIRRKSKNRTC